jgi:hypothetical protein
MAAATYVVVTVIDLAKSYVDDVVGALGVAGQWDNLGGDNLDYQYTSIMLNNLVGNGETTYTLQKQTTGLYTYTPGTALWFANNTTPFTGEDDVTYRVYGEGPHVYVSSGTATADTIDIVGARVDFPAMMGDVFLWLADRFTMRVESRIDDGIDAVLVKDACRDAARLWQGVITSAT